MIIIRVLFNMKKLLPFLTTAVFIAILSGCSQVPKDGAVISGYVTGFAPDDSITVYLMHHDGVSGQSIMVDTLRNGRFQFRLDSLKGEKHYSINLMRIHEDKGSYEVLCFGPEIYLEPGASVNIEGEGKYLYTANITSPVEDQKLRQRFISKMSQDDWEARQDLFTGYYALLNEYSFGSDSSQATKDSLKRMMKDNLAASDSVNNRLSDQELALLETEPIGEFALSSLWSLAIMVSMGQNEYRESVTRLSGRLTEEQRQSWRGKEIISYLQKITPVNVGYKVPGYEFVDAEGDKHFLSELSGKWLLLDYWSRGCGPCIKAAKELAELHKETSDRNLLLVSISLDGEDGWKEASREHGIVWTNWRDPLGNSGSVRAYDQGGIPVFVLVNPEGIIEKIQLGYHDGLLHILTENIN